MNLTEQLRTHRLLAIVRGSDPRAALHTVLALAEEGIGLIEVSLTTPGAFGVIEQARAELGPHAALGAGTVLTTDDAARAATAGAAFLVSPGLGDDLGQTSGPPLPLLGGAVTPSEVMAQARRGATAVKLFPASLGGPDYLRSLRDPFPDIPFVPVGGVDAEAASAYLAVGALAVGVGSPLVGDAARGGDLAELRTRAATWRRALSEEVAA